MKFVRIVVTVALAALLFASCATTSSGTGGGGGAGGERDVFTGEGHGPTLGPAMAAAKIDAVRNAVIDMIGPGAEQANRDKLDEVLYSTRNPNAFVYNETMETLRKENVGTTEQMDMVFELRIRVNRQAIATVLRTNGITGGAASRQESAAQTAENLVNEANQGSDSPADAQAQSAQEALLPQSADWEQATDEEKRFIRRYLDTMSYMVYFNEASKTDPYLMKAAVGQANSYLTSNGMVAIDAAQIETLKRDQQLAYEEEAGQEMSIIQWVAQKLRADVYIELDAATSSESRNGVHYGSANVTMKMFDASTGQLLGSVNRRSQQTVSRSSQQDAVLNALQSTVYQAMPVVINQSKTQMAVQVSRGIRYEIVVQNTSDPRLMSDFRRKIRGRVSEIITVSQSAEQSVYDIYYFGRVDELEDLIYSVSETVPGLEGMYEVLLRGNTITFNTGL